MLTEGPPRLRRRPSNLLADRPAVPASARPDEPAPPKNYVELYGLAKPPFGGPAERSAYIVFNSHRRAFELIMDHLLNGSGAVLLVGDEGVGKTEMLRAAVNVAVEAGQPVIRLFRPRDGCLTREEMLSALAGNEALPDDVGATLLDGPRKAIVIDDFDLLPAECLAELEPLMRAEAGPALVLAASAAARRPELAPLLSLLRNTIRLIPISPAEATQFIERSLWVAGGTTRRLIEPDAVRLIVSRSGGIPGTIGQLMDAALMAGFARGDAMITARTVNAAIGSPRPARRVAHEPAGEGVAARALQLTAIGLFVLGASLFAYKAVHDAVPPPPASSATAMNPGQPPAESAAPPEAAAAKTEAALPADLVAVLVKRGEDSLGLGDVAAARLFFQRAAEAGSGPAALALGKTYDPSQPASHGARPDPARAAVWYRRAQSLGEPDAAGLLRNLGSPAVP